MLGKIPKNYILNSVFDNKTINFFNANNKIEKNNNKQQNIKKWYPSVNRGNIHSIFTHNNFTL